MILPVQKDYPLTDCHESKESSFLVDLLLLLERRWVWRASSPEVHQSRTPEMTTLMATDVLEFPAAAAATGPALAGADQEHEFF